MSKKDKKIHHSDENIKKQNDTSAETAKTDHTEEFDIEIDTEQWDEAVLDSDKEPNAGTNTVSEAASEDDTIKEAVSEDEFDQKTAEFDMDIEDDMDIEFDDDETVEMDILELKKDDGDENLDSSRTSSVNDGQGGDFFKNNGKLIAIAAGIVAVIVIIFIAVNGNRNAESESSSLLTTTQGTESLENTSDETFSIDYSQYGLSQDSVPEVKTLFEKYFAAMVDVDMDTLTSIVTNPSRLSKEQLNKKKEYIENYQNISCYTSPGIEEGSYLVYVYYEFKFLNIDTAAPSLDLFYVQKNDDGDLVINNESTSTYSDELKALIDEIRNTEDYKNLYKLTERQLTEAVEADSALKNLYDKLMEGASSETTAAQESTENTTAESKTEAPTTQESTTESTTQATTAATSDDGFTSVNDTVQAAENVRVRKSPSTDAESLGLLPGGESVERIGYNDTWSKVVFDGQTGYILTELLLINTSSSDTSSNNTSNDVTFTDVNETVTALVNCKIRTAPSTDAEIINTLPGGDTITRTGNSGEWSRVDYNGQTGYIASEFLR